MDVRSLCYVHLETKLLCDVNLSCLVLIMVMISMQIRLGLYFYLINPLEIIVHEENQSCD